MAILQGLVKQKAADDRIGSSCKPCDQNLPHEPTGDGMEINEVNWEPQGNQEKGALT